MDLYVAMIEWEYEEVMCIGIFEDIEVASMTAREAQEKAHADSYSVYKHEMNKSVPTIDVIQKRHLVDYGPEKKKC